MKTKNEEDKLLKKLTKKEWDICRILVEEMISWKSTTKVSVEEIIKLIKLLSKKI